MKLASLWLKKFATLCFFPFHMEVLCAVFKYAGAVCDENERAV